MDGLIMQLWRILKKSLIECTFRGIQSLLLEWMCNSWGKFFVHFFPLNFLEKRFFKTFSAENSIFSQHFGGKIFRGIFPGIFPGKNVQKIGPWREITCWNRNDLFFIFIYTINTCPY
jgi:hypothetical protein